MRRAIPYHITFTGPALALATLLTYLPSRAGAAPVRACSQIQVLRQASVDVKCVFALHSLQMQPPTPPLPKNKRSLLIKCAISHEQGRTCTIWGDIRNVAHLVYWGGVALQNGMSGTMIPFPPTRPTFPLFFCRHSPNSLGRTG